MARPEATPRRRLLVVGAGFVAGGLFIGVLASVIGIVPGGRDVVAPGLIGGAVPVLIGLALITTGLLLRRR